MACSWARRLPRSPGWRLWGLALCLSASASAADMTAVDAALARERQRNQEVARSVQETLAQAREMRAASRYMDARNLYARAERLDPANDEAIRGRMDMERRLASSESAQGAVAGAIERTKIMNASATINADNALAQAKTLYAEAAAAIPPDEAKNLNRLASLLGERKRALNFAVSRLADAESQFRSMPPAVDTAARLRECAQLRTEIDLLNRDIQAKLTTTVANQANELIRQTQSDIGGAQSKNIKLWRDNAEQCIKRREWDQARQYLNAILKEREYDEAAKRRLLDVDRMAIAALNEQATTEYRYGQALLMNKIDRVTADIPLPGKIIDYPDDWSEKLRVRNAKLTSGGKIDEETAAVYAKLGQLSSVGFLEASVSDFKEWLEDQTGLVVTLSKDLSDAQGAGANVSINLSEVSNMRIETILNNVTAIAGLTWQPWYGGILLQLKDSVGSGTMITFNSDVRDLLIRPAKIRKLRKLGLLGDGGDDGDDDDDDDDDEEDESEYMRRNLATLIREVMSYAFAAEGEGSTSVEGSVKVDARKMLSARGTPRDIRVLEQLLKDMRATKQLSVSTMVRFLEMSDTFWEEFDSSFTDMNQTVLGNDIRTAQFGVDKTWNSDPHNGETRTNASSWNASSKMQPRDMYSNIYDPAPVYTGGMTMSISGFGWLGKTNARWLLRAVKESNKADILYAPHVVCYNNNTGQVEHTRKITDANPSPSENGEGWEMDLENYEDGISLRVRPLVSADRKYITMYLAPRMVKVDDNFTAQGTMWVNGITTDINLRGGMITETRTFATIPNGGTVLLSGLSINVQMQSRTGVPVLQDIPVFGAAFSRRALQREKRNFMTMVSSDIITLEDEEAKVNIPPVTVAGL